MKNSSFSGDLKKGSNKIPFVVKIENSGTWTIDTKAAFDGFVHFHKIELKSNNEKIYISYYLLPKQKIIDAS